jgi:hypothetical protein
MDRREMVGLIGSLGFGLSLGASRAQADGHGSTSTNGSLGPVAGFHLHFCGIHVAKADPKLQLIVQHYCGPRKDMHQCLLYDSTAKDAKLIGVEYIIPDSVYRSLPDSEKKYWHPHTYEVLAGGLIAPGMKPDEELNFMKELLPTWGKTWHTWPDPTTPVPMGEPMLMWALTGDGQSDEKVLAERDRLFNVSTETIRQERVKAIGYEVPQVPQPTSVDAIGRQWTATGEDKPTRRE